MFGTYSKMKITLIAGARPNFMKIAPIIKAIEKARISGHSIEYRLVHTGQHYDDRLSSVFFEELEIPPANSNLGAGSGTQAEQTAKIMIEFEKELMANPCDLVMVVGDVNSTLACTIVAKKLNTKVAHVEGGIRSFDMTMPEEVNRIVTDSLADYFFTTSTIANENLLREGKRSDQLFFVGNTMIDSLLANQHKIRKPELYDRLQLTTGSYFVLTLHRPSNVDDPEKFSQLIQAVDAGARSPVIFPVHPRTKKNFAFLKPLFVKACEPLSYLEFIFLIKNAKAIITDSGGVQEETTVLGIPCVTLRKSTERPETVTVGTNEVIGNDFTALQKAFEKIRLGAWKRGRIPELWDGKSAERIVENLSTLSAINKLP
jgi:UDP-N-acetylglucosamine 2-epimerase (non-hydrolysing)